MSGTKLTLADITKEAPSQKLELLQHLKLASRNIAELDKLTGCKILKKVELNKNQLKSYDVNFLVNT